jgi:pyroglutamyl-peptidase
MKTVLLTGFEPFGGNAVNPSQLVAMRLDGAELGGCRVIGATLACEFDRSISQLKVLMEQHQPALIVCLGLAENRVGITPERVAINVDDARIPDNAGFQPAVRPVVQGGTIRYWSTLPIQTIMTALLDRGFPASISESAGTFVCNHVFYGLMHELARLPDAAPGGFIHIPPLAGTPNGQAGLPLDQMIEAVTIAIETSLRVQRGSGVKQGASG